MAAKRKKRTQKGKAYDRKPFWEGVLEWVLGFGKKLLLPALLIWLISWLWLGGLFERAAEATWQGFVHLTAEQGLQVKDVIVTGRIRTDKKDLQRAVKVVPGDPVLNVDIDRIQKKLEALRWVDHVTVKRNLNGIVTIDINEKIPFVIWARPGRQAVVLDTKGQIIPETDASDFENLLMIEGVNASDHVPHLIKMLKAEPIVAERIRSATWIGDRRWTLYTADGTAIHLPDDDIGYALSRLAKLQKTQNVFSKSLLSIDLRLPDRIIIESKDGEARSLSGQPQPVTMTAI